MTDVFIKENVAGNAANGMSSAGEAVMRSALMSNAGDVNLQSPGPNYSSNIYY